jgi:uncharacterized protein YqgC (DUF456 family)
MLRKTGQQVALSKVFAGFSDKRELQAAQPAPFLDRSEGQELWLDYVCDLGDGFDATASVASVLTQPSLTVPGRGADSTGITTTRDAPRGELLVLGGDQVYPFASIQEYKDRLVGPYAAMFCEPNITGNAEQDLPERLKAPLVVAVPGNHDWYDGLTAFTRLFTLPSTGSKRWPWLGGWKVEQQRSYFAVKLPQHWWLWGIDIQLDTYIDNGQLAWFKDVVTPKVEAGDGIILCSAKPSWVDADRDAPDAYDNLDYFERKIIEPAGAKLRVALTGDLHYYARYECRDGDGREGEQKIIAGGGGAYLAPTYHLPPSLSLPPSGSSQYDAARVRTYHLAGDDEAGGAACYPTAAQAKGLRWGVLTMGLRNGPGFAALVGAAYALWAYTLLREGDRAWGWVEMARRLVEPWAPLLVLIVAGLALLGFTHERRPSRKWPARGLALVHVAGHAVVIVTLAWALERAWGAWADDEPFAIGYRLGVALLVGLIGALVGPVVLALYLLVADTLARVNTNELFAAQRIEDWKCFLRLHIDTNGDLTIYPIAIDRVARRWHAVEEASTRQGPWLVPDQPIVTRPIEPPIVVTRVPGATQGATPGATP